MHAPKAQLWYNLAAITAALLFGASLVAIRAAVHDVPPLTLAFLRFAQGSLLLGAFMLLRDRSLPRVARGDLGYLALVGVLFYTVFPIVFNTSLRYIPASRGALLLASMPLWALLLAHLVTRDSPTRGEIIGAFAAIGGMALVFGRAAATAVGPHRTLGDALMIATAICGAVHNIMVKPMLAKYPALTVTFYAMTIGTVVILPFAWLVEGLPLPPASNVGLVWLLVVIGIAAAIGFALWTFALRRVSATRAAIYLNLNPTFAVILSALVLHERLTPEFGIGFVMVVAGVFIASRDAGAGSGKRRGHAQGTS